ncbi:MAG: hypothetical protein VR73_02325 [Gammaproteobacteria bacterium BRH_c0]|nr:MAG: hypothetical protein VR73_02325 [Gammaproteobacteria bacterium BRH_c0]
MTVYNALLLFLLMGCLAAVPSSSVALVVIRSATLNIRNGIAASCGIVTGDLIFTLMAILGLSALADSMGAFFAIIRYLAAGYLIWFGIGLIKNTTESRLQHSLTPGGGTAASFIAGLTLTMGDIKAILFYASLFPAFVDIAALSWTDVTMIVVITVTAVGGVKTLYALCARKLLRFSGPIATRAKPLAGVAMIATGGYLLSNS